MTSNPLNKIKDILDELEKDLDEVKKIWDEMREINPHFDQLSEEHWIERRTYSWLHGATNVQESNELEQWLFDSPSPSYTAKMKASEAIKHWKNYLKDNNSKYNPLATFKFYSPLKNETLEEFLKRMAIKIAKEGFGEPWRRRKFKNFLDYFRNLISEEHAFIEHIFPYKMDIFHGMVIRKVAPEVFAIPVETASSILIDLANQIHYGRPNVQYTAAESLGLCWICLTASRLRLPVHLEMLHKFKTTSLHIKEKRPQLSIPTLFGDRKIQISSRVAQYLQTLSQISSKKQRLTILQRPLRSLTRCLASTIKKLPIPSDFGNITYVSLMSSPHHAGLHRYQPK